MCWPCKGTTNVTSLKPTTLKQRCVREASRTPCGSPPRRFCRVVPRQGVVPGYGGIESILKVLTGGTCVAALDPGAFEGVAVVAISPLSVKALVELVRERAAYRVPRPALPAHNPPRPDPSETLPHRALRTRVQKHTLHPQRPLPFGRELQLDQLQEHFRVERRSCDDSPPRRAGTSVDWPNKALATLLAVSTKVDHAHVVASRLPETRTVRQPTPSTITDTR